MQMNPSLYNSVLIVLSLVKSTLWQLVHMQCLQAGVHICFG